MVRFFLFLSFIFGKSKPRVGREGSLVTGVLIYIIYLSLLVVFRESYSNSLNFLYIGLWPVHVIFLLFGTFMYLSDGRANIQILAQSSRLQISAIIFIIFALLIWLSS